MMMDSDQFVAASGPVDARYLAFLETVSTLRPSLHRYCARMTGSVMDGEDVVQEADVGGAYVGVSGGGWGDADAGGAGWPPNDN